MPQVSIVMSVRNCQDYILDSIESILGQSFRDFELLVFDDLSTDNTVKLIQKFKDNRLRLFQLKKGFIYNLNYGLNIATGDYIARMDGDDIMNKEKLMRQVNVLNSFPEITVCGSNILFYNQMSEKITPFNSSEGLIELPLLQLLYGNFITNSTSLFRKKFIIDNDIKYLNYKRAEDYKFWVDFAKYGAKFYMFPQELLYYRISKTQVTQRFSSEVDSSSEMIRMEILKYYENLKGSEFANLLRLNYDLVKRKSLSFDAMVDFFYTLLRNELKNSSTDKNNHQKSINNSVSNK